MSEPPPLPPPAPHELAYAGPQTQRPNVSISGKLVLPHRSPGALACVRWTRIAQIGIVATPMVVVGILKYWGTAPFSFALPVLALGSLIIIGLAFNLFRFNRHAMEQQTIWTSPDCLHFTSVSNYPCRFELHDIERVVTSPREFGLFGCSDLYLRSRTTNELTRVLMAYDSAVVADVAAFIEAHRKTTP